MPEFRRSPTTSSMPSLLGSRQQVDLVAAFASRCPSRSSASSSAYPNRRASLGEEFTRLLVPTSTPEEYAAAKAASDAVVAMLRTLVAGKGTAPGDDLVSATHQRPRRQRSSLDTRELLSTIFQLIVAGHDTTASLDRQQPCRAVPRSSAAARAARRSRGIPTAVEEFPRYDSPVPHSTFRYASAPLSLGGVAIPAGEQVIICWAAANRDQGPLRESRVFPPRAGCGRVIWPSGTASITGSVRRWRAWRVTCSGRSSTVPAVHPRRPVGGPALESWRRSRAARPFRVAYDPRPSPPRTDRPPFRRVRTVSIRHASRRAVGEASTRAGAGWPPTSPPSAEPPNCREYVALHHHSASAPAIGFSTSPAGRVSPSSSPASAGPGAQVSMRRRAWSRWPGPEPGRGPAGR